MRSWSAYGPQISRPGAPAMPWRSVRTVVPSMVMVDMLKNFSCSSGPPLSFSMTDHAFGPWIWNR